MIPLSVTMKRVSHPSRGISSTKKRQPAKLDKKKRGLIRIISGQWRGKRLPVLDAEGLRPTTDRNKETLFNWLMAYVDDAKCLDVFAGSGGLGLEALSRYASRCDFIELDRQASDQLSKNLQMLNVNDSNVARVHQGDALKVLQQLTGTQYDIVFIDPPFYQNLVAPVVSEIVNANLVCEGSMIYIEHETELESLPLPSHWHVIKEKRTGSLVYMLVEVGETNPPILEDA
ncbi:MAG: 16S rRNA (guanine(966)-N(2))-methyltransferase RsmD [Alteromonas sp.]|uniref:16S rRNA (guanine(966)-N(2))-methyltransferase RsmD n=1 Tax=Alteromonas sp. TaxID=232 RepID=UPI0032D9411E